MRMGRSWIFNVDRNCRVSQSNPWSCRRLHPHYQRGYDSDAVVQHNEIARKAPNILPKRNLRRKFYYSPVPYPGRKAVKRMFCRFNDFRRLPSSYNSIAKSFLAAVCVAAVSPSVRKAHIFALMLPIGYFLRTLKGVFQRRRRG